jgi:ribonucleoside-diphosphate reductase alpha chain
VSIKMEHTQKGFFSSPLLENPEKFPKPQKPQGTWSEASRRVLEERYLVKEGEKVVETPDEMCWRVAADIAEAEQKWASLEEIYNVACEFYAMMVEKKFVPNSPTLMNAGKKNGLQYSACYVLPVEDSLDKIFESIKNAAIIHQSGGGTGFAFSRLRPKNSLVRRSHGKASGPVSFLRVFDAATEAVKQGGKRRGANMGILKVDHPDILEFIECKLDGGITNFNISVAITEEFMKTYEEDREYELIAPHTKQVTGKLKAREVFDRICQAAWRTGDPGCIFIDRINSGRANPVPEMGPVEATNPCGEQPLYPNEACNLGSINLSKFVVEKDGKPDIDWNELERVVRLSVRFLDDVIERNPYPLPEIDATVKANRRIGLGVMGWADLLFMLRIPYNSEEALKLAEKIMAFLQEFGHDASANLAKVRGPFPNWSKSIYKNDRPLRNSTVTTIAPTGSISIIADCSSGIEPIFALAFMHKVGDRQLNFINPWLVEALKSRDLWNDVVRNEIIKTGEIGHLDFIPEEIRRVFVTAHEVPPEWHVRMQGAFQKFTDNAVSKTVNLPNSATVEDVKKIYLLAYDVGCQGITIFRDGCKNTQVLHRGIKDKEGAGSAPKALDEEKYAIKPRPRKLSGTTIREKTPTGTSYITLNCDEHNELFEVFVNVGKAGSDVQADSEAIGRLISLILRIPSPWSAEYRVREVVNQLRNIGGRREYGFGPSRVRSIPDAVAKVLAEHVLGEANGNGEHKPVEEKPAETVLAKPKSGVDICPECGSASLILEEGCSKCYDCGFSSC